ncbi:hypothetical protein EJ419_05375 [Alloscardovia theropitheci]|uniref:DUF559 domain-containing protein n=2 Tax=Alloscardovia theropitheci TaxID=2496842 RepID=A0A4R0QRU0_9BIFI|nr:hypothetical protein EJ419_05375 [Alloscardovia theropitheci]
MLPFEDALIICDKLAKKFSITYKQMLNFTLGRHRCWKSIIAGFKEQFVDPKSENGGESFCRARMIRAGISIPLLQVEIPNPLHSLGKRIGSSFQNTRMIRPDYVWNVPSHVGDFTSIAAELDGKQKYINSNLLQQSHSSSTTDIILREKDRETALNLSGFKVVRFQFEEALANHGAIMIEKLRLAGVPFVDTWQKRKRQRLLARILGDKTLHKLQ